MSAAADGSAAGDLAAVRAMFPALSRSVHGKRLVYLDSAASAQKPSAVLDAMDDFYSRSYANVHRGVHALAEEATAAYEEARADVARLLGAHADEIVFTSGTTGSINIAAHSLVPTFDGGEIVVTAMEHHSNFVVWQQLAKRHGMALVVIPVRPDFTLDMARMRAAIGPATRVVAFSHASNVLGTINPAKEICELARAAGALTVIDGAQAVPHLRVDVEEIGCDLYACSGHKMYGPTGIGALYGRRELLARMAPAWFGGEMVHEVTIKETTWAEPPMRFEPGTPNIAGAIGMGAAARFLRSIGHGRIAAHERDIVAYALPLLAAVPGLSIIGPQAAEGRIGAISFTLEGVHPHDVAAVLDGHGVAVRAGHHCAQPLHCMLGVDSTSRASVGIYTTRDDIDVLVRALSSVREVFG